MDTPTICLLALSQWPLAPSLGDAPNDEGCMVFDADVAGRYTQPLPDGPGAFNLERSRFETGTQVGQNASARLAIDTVRDDPAVVMRLQIAEGRLHLPAAGLTVVAGAIDNAWVFGANTSFGWRPVSGGLGQAVGWQDRSDLGGGLIFSAPKHVATVDLRAVAGDGLNGGETNDGTTGQFMVAVRPFAVIDGQPTNTLEIDLFAQRGTRGPADANDHQLGARVHGGYKGYRAGFEVLQADGIAGDGTASGTGMGTWLSARPWGPLVVVGRYDGSNLDQSRIVAAVGAIVPEHASNRGANLLAGLQQFDAGGQSSSSVFLQLGVRARGVIGVQMPGIPES